MNKWESVAQSPRQKQTVGTRLKMAQLLELEDKGFQSAVIGMFENVKETTLNR